MTVGPVKNCFDGEWISIPLVYNSNVETDTGYDIPAGAVIYPWDMFLVVTTAESGRTINVGILSTESGGSASGFISGFSLATAGTYCVSNMVTATDGSNQNYISANNMGSFFFAGINGANSAGDAGLWIPKAFIGNGVAKSITYTCSSGTSSFTGKLIFRQFMLI